jgi:hypothetical protein
MLEVFLKRFTVLVGTLFLVQCNHPNSSNSAHKSEKYEAIAQEEKKVPLMCVSDTPLVTQQGISGTYRGVEFVSIEMATKMHLTGTDVAHQYSNKICEYVGKELKKRYRLGHFSKVDFSKIRMLTKGMQDGDDYVEYTVFIPLIRVSKQQATTAFDHCGGWGHTPALKERKKSLLHGSKKIVKNNRLEISKKFKTPEGLEEYWIQWKHTDFQ